jgi:tight adherence protein C
MEINQELIFAIGLFATVTVLAFALSGLVFRRDRVTSRLRRSLPQEQEVLEAEPVDTPTRHAVAPVMERIGHAAARPFMPKSPIKQSKLRRQLMNAGIYTPQAMELIVGLKVILLALGAVTGYAIGSMIGGVLVYICVYTGALIGFLTPGFWLNAKIAGRRKALDAALPDALDLMVVCVESGLTLDASLNRVGHEISLAHPDISKEFGITHMETRVGLSRIDALRNLGQRTGCASLQSLAAMLVQTERFGTSIAQALRVHAESLRVKRQHAAEEQAAKTSVKLAFPVVLFIFPTLLVVLGGPAIILFLKSPLFHRG